MFRCSQDPAVNQLAEDVMTAAHDQMQTLHILSHVAGSSPRPDPATWSRS